MATEATLENRKKKRVYSQKKKALVDFYKSEGCIACGTKDNLTFHHRDPARKKFCISQWKQVGIDRLRKELEKCDVLCAACHRILHKKDHLMKCEAMIRRVESGKKRKTTRISHIFSLHQQLVMRIYPAPNYPEEEFERCDGAITADVFIDRDGGCSCCGNSWLEISYRCEKCGCQHFPELPNDTDDLSKLLTEYVANLSKTKRRRIIGDIIIRQKEMEETQRERQREYTKELKKRAKKKTVKKKVKSKK